MRAVIRLLAQLAEAPTPRVARRCERDLAILALTEAGLSTRQISRLRVGDVRVLPSGNVLVRLGVDEGILRGAKFADRRPLAGRLANRVARYCASRAGAEPAQPLFAGRRTGAPLHHTSIMKVVSHQREHMDRRDQ